MKIAWSSWIYLPLLLAAFAAALAKGGEDERTAAWISVLGSLATPIVVIAGRRIYGSPDYGLIAVDILVLAATLRLSLKSDRYWPMLLAALSIANVLTHVPRIMDADISPLTYRIATALWSYPKPVIIMVAVVRYRQRLAAAKS